MENETMEAIVFRTTSDDKELLEKHGATKLSEIDPQKYAALLAEAEVLGNG